MSLDNFKNFVKENPKLANFVRNGDMTWQKFYELYDLYGPFHDIWNKYLGITTNGVFSFKDMLVIPFIMILSILMPNALILVSSFTQEKSIFIIQLLINIFILQHLYQKNFKILLIIVKQKKVILKNLLMNLDLFLRILMINECRYSI